MATPRLDVYLPDGTQQSFPLTDERVVVGTSSKCQVLIDRPELSAEHLLLSPRPEGCWVAVARGVVTPTIVDGQPFERGMVPWGREIIVGPVRMALNDGTRAAKPKARESAKDDKEKTSPVLLVAAAVVAPICLYLSFANPEAEAVRPVSITPPALFDSLQRACPQSDPTLVTATAQESSRVALSKAERMPFRTQDGIEAVTYYAQAAACFRAAGDGASAAAAMNKATGLSTRLEDEYRAHRFRLERALELDRTDDALYEVRMLTALVSHRQGPYLAALNTMERQLTLKLDQAAATAR